MAPGSKGLSKYLFYCQAFQEVKEERALSLLSSLLACSACYCQSCGTSACLFCSSNYQPAGTQRQNSSSNRGLAGSQTSKQICKCRVQAACMPHKPNPGNLESSASWKKETGCPSLRVLAFYAPTCSSLAILNFAASNHIRL